ncbi:Mut7-C RNAse domain-containing protein [uncultured Photobacterium sp.]|uniref:Mut7-C RNAse domain-containing protein n=1 Tax=uncultured Photobacterium sp. TaxID=173973 RepID=UPI00260F256B|nr:Mut7-C RNAse domain-containing protein [uncultured Photobacterium sp.]
MKDDQHAPILRTAYFRFYEELNDFLPPEQRKVVFSYAFNGKPAIKDTIEAIGVPHTEIDLILVDGESVGFDFNLCGGEHISVYPVIEALDISSVIHLRAAPLRDIKFVVDVNLGKLAQKLRLLGFDTLYRNDFTDNEIVDLSLREKRIILTRDRGIFKYSNVTHGYWVRNHNTKKQLAEVVERLQLEQNFRPFTRCSHCNQILQPIDKEKLNTHDVEQVPKEVLQFFERFWECQGCKKVYWQGSHYDRIGKWICQLKRRIPAE